MINIPSTDNLMIQGVPNSLQEKKFNRKIKRKKEREKAAEKMSQDLNLNLVTHSREDDEREEVGG